MKLQSNIWKYYLFCFFRSLLFHVPIFIVYWSGYLSLFEVMIVGVVLTAAGIVFEVPSGIFADLYGRKLSIQLGTLTIILAYVLFIAAPGLGALTGSFFLWFFLAEAVIGVGKSFFSGADSALLYDSLKQLKKEHLFKKIYSNAIFYGLIALGCAAFLGGLLTRYGIATPYYFSIASFCVVAIIAFSFREPKHFKKVGKRNYWLHQKECLIYAMTHKRVRWLILYYGSLFGLSAIGIIFFLQKYMQHIDFPLDHFGLIYFFLLMFGALTVRAAPRIESYFGERLTLFVLPVVLGVTYIFMGLVKAVWGLLFLFAIEAVHNFMQPILDHYTHEHLKSEQRATVISIRNLAVAIILAVFSPLIGWVGDYYSLATAFLISGVITIVFSSVVILFWSRNIEVCD